MVCFNLDKSSHFDAGSPDDVGIVRCSTHWNVAKFVKLDSPLLFGLIKQSGGDADLAVHRGVTQST